MSQTYYLTKFVVSAGAITEVVPVRVYRRGLVGRIAAKEFAAIQGHVHDYEVGKDIFDDRAAAVADAKKRIAAKIAGLKRQIKKLESIHVS